MIVKELIKQLETLPQSAQVEMSSDAEGNSLSPLEAVETEWFYDDEPIDSHDVECGDYEHLDIDQRVILWPV